MSERNPILPRRTFLSAVAATAAGAGAAHLLGDAALPVFGAQSTPKFKISLAQWSFHKALFAKKLDNLDFARTAKRDYGIDGVEYVNQFFKDKATDQAYLTEMKTRAAGEGVRNVLIMIDAEGALGDADAAARTKAIDNHKRWVDAAKFLGCHSIRVNAQSTGTDAEQRDRVADGLGRLTQYAAPQEINVIVENHGGLSSNGAWLASVMKKVGNPRCGTLPDFGNFKIAEGQEYDRYKGIEELMPFAKGVSAKSHDFNEKGDEIHTDYYRMMKIVLAAGYHGYVGIEYEGEQLSEPDGVRATKKLLDKILATA